MSQLASNLNLRKPAARTGGLAAWSIRHPVGVAMIALAVIVLGVFTLGRLAIDLLPHIIYPDIRVRILDPGVPATVMEDRVTRQLEEQLAITEDAIAVQSTTNQGLTTVDLSFAYGKDIDIALRDASTRLDRAKRFLPDSIDPPVIYKRDPSQIPVQEFVVSSNVRDSVELRTWVDDVFRKWFLNLPGVAAAEVGGGLIREIQIRPDQQRLAGVGLTMQDLIDALQKGNREDPAGRLQMTRQELAGKISGRFTSVEQIRHLPLRLPNGNVIYLDEVAETIDTHNDERLRVRANNIPGVKLSIQKQPAANTVSVVDVVNERIDWLRQQGLLPEDIEVTTVSDQSIYIRHSLRNSTTAALSGALLAMAVVYIFLGNLRRTLIIGSAIPIAIMVTFVFMGIGGLTLNVMTLGGLALGVGMLVDNTIVMLENIYRHQREGENPEEAGVNAAAEVNSAIVASTSTNLAAVLPFLFIGGLTGLLFRELIFTISAAILASMVIALTLVPSLAAKVRTVKQSATRKAVDSGMAWLQEKYSAMVGHILKVSWLVPLVFIVALGFSLPTFFTGKQIFLPKMDDGLVTIQLLTDPGTTLDEMDRTTQMIENMLYGQPEVETVFTLAGGSIFGRTEREIPNRTTITVQLVPLAQRTISSGEWIKKMQKDVAAKQLAGLKVRIYQRGIRGIRTSRGDDDISLRIQGPNLKKLEELADDAVQRLQSVKGLNNVAHSSEEENFEISIEIDRDRAKNLGLDVRDISQAMRIALDGIVVTDFIQGDRAYDVRLRLPRTEASNPQELESIVLFPAVGDRPPVHLGSVARVQLVQSPATIMRDAQMRIIEVTASVAEDATLGGVLKQIETALAGLPLPQGYNMYDGGAKEALQEGRQMTYVLLALALFLVFVVMAVQYESLRNPIVIIFSVPFAAIGVAIGIYTVDLPISMPVWLGMIMLAGIVVNNAIVLVEYIEILREQGMAKADAIVEAARLRLRPILMTTLTTVVGMLPLALGWGEGAEMLQPLAVTIVAGLSFSVLVSLLFVPVVYSLFHVGEREAVAVKS
ncbi:MAG: acriflavin resistance protein [Gammaproteobacteria bacterium SG8_11]|nr:MAG: acriflavin resistance protein [Gammaproteobacteria bacterium SG8_11]